MSAIAGIVHFTGEPARTTAVEAMTAAMASRGPHGISHLAVGAAALGQCMLRTTPESLEETQPLANEDRSVVLVMDGRVDNFDELRAELRGRGAAIRDRSDAELVLRAYEAWGGDCPAHIIGEFAFFAWDTRRHCLFGARDAAGTRHFYFHAEADSFAFSSEIAGLLATKRIEPRINESRLLDYVISEFDRDDQTGTFYEGIERLPAGHAMRVSREGVAKWRYWDPSTRPEAHFASMDECAEAFLDQLRTAVKCRLRSNGPVGSMLSGGLDSSSIVGLIREEFRDCLRQPLRTYSLVRADRNNCPEWRSVHEMLREGWIEPTVLTPDIAGDACDEYLQGLGALNEPFALSHGLCDSLVYRAARLQGCRVVLDGMAGDLLFYHLGRSLALRHGMARRIPAMVVASHRHKIERPWRTLAWTLMAGAAPSIVRAAYRHLRDRITTSSAELDLLHRGMARRYLASKRDDRQRSGGYSKAPNDRAAHARDFTSGLLSFAHEVHGQLALAQGVEPRSPFSDRRMIEFAVSMPLQAKLFADWYKLLLRKSMAGILPEPVRWRRDVGMHPGREYYERFFAEIPRHAPDVWSREVVERKLGQWVAAPGLARAWSRYGRSAHFDTGLALFSLGVLARWLDGRFVAEQIDHG